MNQGVNNHYLGLAAEFRIISELLLRGYNPGRLVFDAGTDIILDNGIRIQVKTTRERFKKNALTYICMLKGGRRRDHKIIEDDFDFIIFWLSGTDIFYILPKSEIPNQWTFEVSPNGKYRNRSKYTRYKNNWDLIPGNH